MLDLLPVRHVEVHPEQLNNYVGLWYMNTFAEKEKLKKNLTKLYGQYLENRQINNLVRKYTGNNALDIKARAYQSAYKEYTLQLTNFGTSLVTNFGTSFVTKLPKAPGCPSGVKPLPVGGLGAGGTARVARRSAVGAVSMAGRGAVVAVSMAGRGVGAVGRGVAHTVMKPFQGRGNSAKNANSAKKAINQMNLLPNNLKKILKNKINNGKKPDNILRNARALRGRRPL